MIQCFINGRQAYPKIGDRIKVTKENPFVTNSESYTFDVTFPMDIHENRDVFGNVNRIDVRKKKTVFQNCRIIADNREVISGIGTVTSVTNEEVKVQFLSGQSAMKYVAKAKDIYIDRISTYVKGPAIRYDDWRKTKYFSSTEVGLITTSNVPFVGVRGKYAYMPVFDRVAGNVRNQMLWSADSPHTPGDSMMRPSLQPNLMYVLNEVMKELGYTVTANAYNVDPWNRLYILSTKMTSSFSKALPHWTAETFLDEFRKLFNASFLFDDKNKTVAIVRNNELTAENHESYEPLDEFSTEYDEDGVEYLGTSNIEYAIEADADRSYDMIPQEVLENFEVVDLTQQNIDPWSQSEEYQRTHLFKDNQGYFFKYVEEQDGQQVGSMARCGHFTRLQREGSSDNTIKLKIVPAGMSWQNVEIRDMVVTMATFFGGRLFLPVIDAEDSGEEVETEGTDEEESYVSVQDVMEGASSATRETTEEDTVMQLVFVADEWELIEEGSMNEWHLVNYDSLCLPRTLTDFRIKSRPYNTQTNCISLALNSIAGLNCIGSFHQGGLQGNGDFVAKNFQLACRFLTDSIPDPRKVFLIRNKKYLCAKVEIEVTEDGIEDVKTAYLYEMNS